MQENNLALCKIADKDKDRIAVHLISLASTVKDALQQINMLPGDEMTLFSFDECGKICGSLTDGDIRRALLNGASPETPLSSVIYHNFKSLCPTDNLFTKIRDLREKKLKLIPVIDAEGYITDLINLLKVKNILPIDAVLMAGGRGERLRPLTENCPKPLLKVGDKAIIDYNIDNLLQNGVSNIYVTVNYLHEQIEEHFKNYSDECDVKCILEPYRMGTFGAVSLIDKFESPHVLVMNSDLLTTLSLEDMYAHHNDSEADITMAVVPYVVSVPFAILNTDGDRVTSLEEKPVYNYFANAGVYIMKREIAAMIPKDSYTDAPDFIRDMIEQGRKVSYFPIVGTWIDIGSPDDYTRACELMKQKREFK
jgi:dTDP-glucose pyrophosphorylase